MGTFCKSEQFYSSRLSSVYTIQAIPAIMENKVAHPIPSFMNAPANKPIIPARIITMIDITVLNFFMFIVPPQITELLNCLIILSQIVQNQILKDYNHNQKQLTFCANRSIS